MFSYLSILFERGYLLLTLLLFQGMISFFTGNTPVSMVFIIATSILFLKSAFGGGMVGNGITLFLVVQLLFVIWSFIDNAFVVVINGARFLILPLLYYYIGRTLRLDITRFNRYVFVLLLLALPTGFFIDYFATGYFQPIIGRRDVADNFGGYFGKQPGEYGFFLTILMVYFFHLYLVKLVGFSRSVFAFFIVGFAAVLSEFKLFFLLLPMLIVSYVTTQAASLIKLYIKPLIIIAIFIAALGSYYTMVFTDRAGSLTDFFFSQKAIEYSLYDSGEMESNIGRFRTVAIAYEYISKYTDLEFYTGLGVGNGADYSSRYLGVKQNIKKPSVAMHGYTTSLYLYEMGIIGFTMIFVFGVYIALRTRRYTTDPAVTGDVRNLAVFVFTYASVMFISIPYNSSFLNPGFATFFWLLAGKLEATIEQRT